MFPKSTTPALALPPPVLSSIIAISWANGKLLIFVAPPEDVAHADVEFQVKSPALPTR